MQLCIDCFTTINTVTQKYLEKHSLAIDLSKWPQGMSWDYVLVIPVCGEAADFLSAVMQHQLHLNVLVILIVNRPDSHVKGDQWFEENEVLLQQFSQHHSEQFVLSPEHQLIMAAANQQVHNDVLLLNFNNQPFDPNKGVGLARRIAADTALALIDFDVIKSPWIFSTDADVVLPKGYFDVVQKVPEKTSALSLTFAHKSDSSSLEKLQSQYDFKLKYYQQGIRYVGAAYDYIPLGSTLIMRHKAIPKSVGFLVEVAEKIFMY